MANHLTTIILPVKDEHHPTLVKLLYDLERYGYQTIVVDDGSTELVTGSDIRFDPPGRGYGAALKAGIDQATTDLIATMDGDGQHTAWDVKRLEDFFLYFCNSYDGQSHQLDMVIGDRRLRERGRRWVGRKVLNFVASLFAWRWIPDLNSGLRIFRRSVVTGYQPILCNGFSFTTSLTLSMLTDGYQVDWLPIKVHPRRQGQSKVRPWRDGWVTLKTILLIGIALRTRKLRMFMRPVISRLRVWLRGSR